MLILKNQERTILFSPENNIIEVCHLGKDTFLKVVLTGGGTINFNLGNRDGEQVLLAILTAVEEGRKIIDLSTLAF
jgi:hypothetical protein